MQEIICDICKTKTADLRIKAKVSEKMFFQKVPFWLSWEEVDVCEDCGAEILKLIRNKKPK